MTVSHLQFQPLNPRSPASWPSHSRPAWSGWFWWGRCSAFWCPFKANTQHSQRLHCFIDNQFLCFSLYLCRTPALWMWATAAAIWYKYHTTTCEPQKTQNWIPRLSFGWNHQYLSILLNKLIKQNGAQHAMTGILNIWKNAMTKFRDVRYIGHHIGMTVWVLIGMSIIQTLLKRSCWRGEYKPDSTEALVLTRRV